jgi:hypothetical protein
MRAQKETTLFTVLTGSHLYGTATEKSDFDYKAVCLPALDDLLLNTQVTNRKEKPEGLKAGDKMLAGESETEYLPLQVFFNDFFNGQTYALEVAFATAQYKHTSQALFKENWMWMMQEMLDKFLTKNVKKMVGYAVAQSKLYGLKTERYSTLSETLRVLNQYGYEFAHELFPSQDKATFRDCPLLVERLLALKHVKMCEILNASGGTEMAPALDICGKQFPLTNRVITVVKSLEKSVLNYGERVKEFEGEGVDWKALSHAIRITEQVLELCGTGKLEFPRPNAKFLLDVKSGKVPLAEATAYLELTFSKVDEAVASSVLQERTPALETAFREWKLEKLHDLYSHENM